MRKQQGSRLDSSASNFTRLGKIKSGTKVRYGTRKLASIEEREKTKRQKSQDRTTRYVAKQNAMGKNAVASAIKSSGSAAAQLAASIATPVATSSMGQTVMRQQALIDGQSRQEQTPTNPTKGQNRPDSDDEEDDFLTVKPF